MFLLSLLQAHGQAASQQVGEHATGAAQHTAEAASHGEHIPIIVEKLNDVLGPAVFNLQAQLMPPLYKVFSFLFGPHWPGEGLTYEQYRAAGNLPLPTHVVMFLLVVFVAVVADGASHALDWLLG